MTGTTQRAEGFGDALNRLESDGDIAKFVGDVFADDATLLRPEANQEVAGTAGATEFWQQYLDQFDEVSSEFTRVVESDDLGVLEWTSSGRLHSGEDVSYRGVSIVDFDADGKVSRFATYYDTTPFSTATG